MGWLQTAKSRREVCVCGGEGKVPEGKEGSAGGEASSHFGYRDIRISDAAAAAFQREAATTLRAAFSRVGGSFANV